MRFEDESFEFENSNMILNFEDFYDFLESFINEDKEIVAVDTNQEFKEFIPDEKEPRKDPTKLAI
jgi:hypothetical protein